MIYSKDRTKLYILILFFIALILRLIAAANTGLSADDANHAVRPIGIMEARKLNIFDQSSILWYYIQEVFYKILGTSQIASRTASSLFGSFLVILVFLFVKQAVKSKKAGLIAATLVTASPFLIKSALPEMDVTVMFFIIFSAYFMLKFVEKGGRNNFLLATVLMGLAIMIKVYAIFFAFSFFLFLCYSLHKKGEQTGKIIKTGFVFLIILLLFCVPTLTYNYLLYKDKGVVDLLFSNYFRISEEKAQQIYGWSAGWWPAGSHPTDYIGFLFGNQKNWIAEYPDNGFYRLPGFLIMLILMTKEDPLIMIFGWLGLILLIRAKDKRYVPFFLVSFIPAFVYLESNIPMLKHFTFIPLLFLPMAAHFLDELDNKIKRLFPNFRLRYILLLLLILGILLAGTGQGNMRGQVYTKSAASQLIDYREEGITKDALVVVDSRIYRGFIGWMFNDRNYIESSLFGQAIQQAANYSKESASIETYFIECVKDDCGWGTIKNQPDFNQSMEQIVSWFANNSEVVAEMSENPRENYYFPVISKYDPVLTYRVYKMTLPLNPMIIPIAKSTHNVMMYPIGYDKTISPVFDDYNIRNGFDGLLNNLAYYLLLICLFASLASWIFLLYLFVKENEDHHNNTGI